jgi:anthranilate phosphoribosyltransferase
LCRHRYSQARQRFLHHSISNDHRAINTTLEKLQSDVLVAHGEAKPKRDKSRPRKSKEKKASVEETDVGTINEEKINPAELGEKRPRARKPKQELSPAELAALRQQLLAELPQRVRPIRRRASRLREIGRCPPS